MIKGAAARRYAQAAFQIAAERREIDRWLQDLETIRATFEDPVVRLVVGSPKVPFADKQRLLDRHLASVSPLARNLAYVIAQNDRGDLVAAIQQEFQRLVNAQRGVDVAEVTTATPLSPDEERGIAHRLSGLTGKQIQVKTRVDPDIIGGLVARIGDRVLDGSVRTRLLALRERLAQ